MKLDKFIDDAADALAVLSGLVMVFLFFGGLVFGWYLFFTWLGGLL